MVRGSKIDEKADLDVAWARADVLRPLMDFQGPKGAMEKGVCQAARDLGVSRATVWRWLQRLQNLEGRASALTSIKRGRPDGSSFLSKEVEEIVAEEIKRLWLSPEKPPLSKLVDAIQLRAKAAGYAPPTRRTVQRRVDALDFAKTLKVREGPKTAVARRPVRGHLKAERPLQIVQVDHTLADVIVVDPVTRETIGRPWLTLAIDIATRVIAGFHITLEAPSTTSVALCLALVHGGTRSRIGTPKL